MTPKEYVRKKYPDSSCNWRIDAERYIQGFYVHDGRKQISPIRQHARQAWKDAAIILKDKHG